MVRINLGPALVACRTVSLRIVNSNKNLMEAGDGDLAVECGSVRVAGKRRGVKEIDRSGRVVRRRDLYRDTGHRGAGARKRRAYPGTSQPRSGVSCAAAPWSGSRGPETGAAPGKSIADQSGSGRGAPHLLRGT